MPVTTYSWFDQLDENIRSDFSYARQRNVFTSLEWFRLLCAHSMPSDLDLRIYHATRNDDPRDACLLVMHQEKNGRFSSLTNCYTMEFSVAFAGDDGDREALIDEVVRHIADERPRWRYANIRFLYSHQTETERLIAAFRRCGFVVNSFFKFENFFADVERQSFDDYYGQRPSRVRNTIKRRLKKLQAEHEFHCRIVHRLDDALADDYARIYAASWKEAEEYPGFIRQMCDILADLGLLRVGFLYVDGVPAAAQVWVLSGRKAVIYKLAYDEKFKDYSVGSILTKEMAQAIMADGAVDEIDYGVGSEPYKADWMDRKRMLIGFEAFNTKTLAGAAMALRWRLEQSVRAITGRQAGEGPRPLSTNA